MTGKVTGIQDSEVPVTRTENLGCVSWALNNTALSGCAAGCSTTGASNASAEQIVKHEATHTQTQTDTETDV